MALVLTGDGAVGPLSATEMTYLDGVTSAVQTQINSKLTTPTWATHTPTWTNLTIGNGTNAWKYFQAGKLVILTGRTTFGSTTSISGGVPKMTLPVTAADSGVRLMGYAALLDAGTATFSGYPIATDDTTVTFFTLTVSGSYIKETSTSATVPFTWTTGDSIQATLIYEAA